MLFNILLISQTVALILMVWGLVKLMGGKENWIYFTLTGCVITIIAKLIETGISGVILAAIVAATMCLWRSLPPKTKNSGNKPRV